MIRNEFIDLVTNTGMATLKDMRRLSASNDDVAEFELLMMSHFDENKFAKIVSEKYSMTFIDLKNAKIPADTISSIKKEANFKIRAIAIQKTPNKVTFATFDPTIVNAELKELIFCCRKTS
jgi:hypothetical protein